MKMKVNERVSRHSPKDTRWTRAHQWQLANVLNAERRTPNAERGEPADRPTATRNSKLKTENSKPKTCVLRASSPPEIGIFENCGKL
jgi:hypothetical protein